MLFLSQHPGGKIKGKLCVKSEEGRTLSGMHQVVCDCAGDAEKSLLIKAVRSPTRPPDAAQEQKALRPPDRRSHTMGAERRALAGDRSIQRVRDQRTPLTKSPRRKKAGGPLNPSVVPLPPLVHRNSQFVILWTLSCAPDSAQEPSAESTRDPARADSTRLLRPHRPAATPEQIATFEQDTSPEAWPRLIDHLLSLPHTANAGPHWLDVARFAQSNGYERDGEKPEAWRYRDYVVKAFNEDKPLRPVHPGADRGAMNSIVSRSTPSWPPASAARRLEMSRTDKRMAEFDELDDVLSTTGSAFLGLTIGCARLP